MSCPLSVSIFFVPPGLNPMEQKRIFSSIGANFLTSFGFNSNIYMGIVVINLAPIVVEMRPERRGVLGGRIVTESGTAVNASTKVSLQKKQLN